MINLGDSFGSRRYVLDLVDTFIFIKTALEAKIIGRSFRYLVNHVGLLLCNNDKIFIHLELLGSEI